VTLVKICGITNEEDALAAVEAGADMLGFQCSGGGLRSVSVDDYLRIASRLPATVRQVGVFAAPASATGGDWRDAPRDLFERFHLIQYGDDAVWPQIIRENWDMRRKIKAFHLTSDRDLRAVASFNGLAQNVLLNVHACAPIGYRDNEAYGWELAREVRQYGKKIYLAGGLDPDTVPGAIARVHPYCVDVSVGVESEPGIKDSGLMRAFVRAVRAQDAR
jgi:phosphoribosylanthranilate isomerase